MDNLLTPPQMVEHLRGFTDPAERHEAVLSTIFADSLCYATEKRCTVDQLVSAIEMVNSRLKGELSQREIFETAAEAYRRSFTDTGHGSPVLADQESHVRTLIEEIQAADPTLIARFGIPKLDEALGDGLLPGEVMSLVGAQGSSKTSLALGMAENFIERTTGRLLFVSYDMAPARLEARRFMRRLDVTENQFRALVRERSPEVERAWSEMQESDGGRFRIVGKTALNPRHQLKESSRLIDLEDLLESVNIEAPSLLILDYVTRIQAYKGRPFRSDLEAVQTIIPRLQEIAERRQIAMLLLSQMGRQSKLAASKGDSGGHGKGGGVLEELVDAEVELLKDAPPEPEEGQLYQAPAPIVATITKCRRAVSGRSFVLDFDGPRMEFTGEARQVRRATAAKPAFAAGGVPF